MRLPVICFALAFAATPAAAVDSCLVGTWEADGGEIARAMSAQMSGAARHVGGRISMQIAGDGTVSMQADALVINVTPDGIPAMDVTVNGYSRGTIKADDGATFEATSADYALVGSANVMGQVMEIPFSSDTGMLGSTSGRYACAGDTAQFEPVTPGSMPGRWQRIN